MKQFEHFEYSCGCRWNRQISEGCGLPPLKDYSKMEYCELHTRECMRQFNIMTYELRALCNSMLKKMQLIKTNKYCRNEYLNMKKMYLFHMAKYFMEYNKLAERVLITHPSAILPQFNDPHKHEIIHINIKNYIEDLNIRLT